MYPWEPEFYATVSLGSLAFWLWLGSSNERHQQEIIGREVRVWGIYAVGSLLMNHALVVTAFSNEGHGSFHALLCYKYCYHITVLEPLLSQNSFRPLCANSTSQLLVLDCFTILC